MTGKTHQILGITAGITYLISASTPAYNPATFGAVLAFSYFSALLPDIDQPNGKLWHLLPMGKALGKLSDPFLEHRNITHSLLGLALVATGLHFLFKTFPSYWGINTHLLFFSCLIAYISHLFLDLWTNEGIPLFFPYKRFFGLPPKPFDGARISTGKWFENLVIFPIIALFLIIFLLSNLSDIKSFLLK